MWPPEIKAISQKLKKQSDGGSFHFERTSTLLARLIPVLRSFEGKTSEGKDALLRIENVLSSLFQKRSGYEEIAGRVARVLSRIMKRSSELAISVDASVDSLDKWIAVESLGNVFILPCVTVVRVVQDASLIEVPTQSPDWVGLLENQGQLIPVVQPYLFAPCIGKIQSKNTAVILLVETGTGQLGIPVEHVLSFLKFDEIGDWTRARNLNENVFILDLIKIFALSL